MPKVGSETFTDRAIANALEKIRHPTTSQNEIDAALAFLHRKNIDPPPTVPGMPEAVEDNAYLGWFRLIVQGKKARH